VREGEIYGLLGPNGAGKTTTISVCTTRALPSAGVVRINGIDVVKSAAVARTCIGVVPQYNTLDRACTIFENINFHCLYFGFSRAEAKLRTEQLLDQFHLSERTGAYPSQLSGGLAQRVQIARAIAHRPKVLFLDEPSAGLDPITSRRLDDLILALRESLGATIVVVTHELESLLAIGDNGVFLDGQTKSILARGAPREMLEHCSDAKVQAFLRRSAAPAQGEAVVQPR